MADAYKELDLENEPAPGEGERDPVPERRITRPCPKCNGTMTLGRLHNRGQLGDPTYVWAPFGEPGFYKRGITLRRFFVVALRCESCGFLEWYAPPSRESRT